MAGLRFRNDKWQVQMRRYGHMAHTKSFQSKSTRKSLIFPLCLLLTRSGARTKWSCSGVVVERQPRRQPALECEADCRQSDWRRKRGVAANTAMLCLAHGALLLATIEDLFRSGRVPSIKSGTSRQRGAEPTAKPIANLINSSQKIPTIRL